MRLGVFDHVDRSQAPPDRLLAGRLRLVAADDRAGFSARPPAKVLTHPKRAIDAGGLNAPLCHFALGDIKPDEAPRALTPFTRQVMPEPHEARLEAAP